MQHQHQQQQETQRLLDVETSELPLDLSTSVSSNRLSICRNHLELFTHSNAVLSNLRHLPNFNSSEELLARIHNLSLQQATSQSQPQSEPNFPWVHVMLPLICSLGITGNVINLVVLTKKRLNNPLRRLEKAASVGLTALALSDLLFCITVFPYTFLSGQYKTALRHQLFVLYYRVYGISAINTFLMSSTWLVVELALERYIVLYYPLRAKCVLGLRRTKVVIISVFGLSALATMPYFLDLQVMQCQTFDGIQMYEIQHTWPNDSVKAQLLAVYQRWVWPFIAVFIPLTLLLYCNIRLIQGLRQVPTSRKKIRCSGQRLKEASTRITLTLIIIVFMAIALIAPAEILKLVDPYHLWGFPGFIAASIANVLQAVNFSFNFVLYCTLDVHFRRICKNLITGHCGRGKGSPTSSDVVVLHVNNTSYPPHKLQGCKFSAQQTNKVSKEKLYS